MRHEDDFEDSSYDFDSQSEMIKTLQLRSVRTLTKIISKLLVKHFASTSKRHKIFLFYRLMGPTVILKVVCFKV